MRPLYGYDYNDGRLTPAKSVRRIFDECISGTDPARIASALNGDGVPTMKDGKWYQATIRVVLDNERCAGNTLFQKSKTSKDGKRTANNGDLPTYFKASIHPAIVTQEVFSKAQEARRKRSKVFGRSVY